MSWEYRTGRHKPNIFDIEKKLKHLGVSIRKITEDNHIGDYEIKYKQHVCWVDVYESGDIIQFHGKPMSGNGIIIPLILEHIDDYKIYDPSNEILTKESCEEIYRYGRIDDIEKMFGLNERYPWKIRGIRYEPKDKKKTREKFMKRIGYW